MFRVKQLFTKNHLLLLHITLFFAHLHSYEVILFYCFIIFIILYFLLYFLFYNK